MNAEERKNIKEIKTGIEFFEAARIIIGDRLPDHYYDEEGKHHGWGFGNPTGAAGEREYMFHRLDGPCIYSDAPYLKGGEGWEAFGRFHRLDGPAFIGTEGGKEWWLYGVRPISWEVYLQFSSLSETDIIVRKIITGEINQRQRWDQWEYLTLENITTIMNKYDD